MESWNGRFESWNDHGVGGWDDRPPLNDGCLTPRHRELARAADRSLGALEVLATHARNQFRDAVRVQGNLGADEIATLVRHLSEIACLAEDRCFLFLKLEAALREVEAG